MPCTLATGVAGARGAGRRRAGGLGDRGHGASCHDGIRSGEAEPLPRLDQVGVGADEGAVGGVDRAPARVDARRRGCRPAGRARRATTACRRARPRTGPAGAADRRRGGHDGAVGERQAGQERSACRVRGVDGGGPAGRGQSGRGDARRRGRRRRRPAPPGVRRPGRRPGPAASGAAAQRLDHRRGDRRPQPGGAAEQRDERQVDQGQDQRRAGSTDRAPPWAGAGRGTEPQGGGRAGRRPRPPRRPGSAIRPPRPPRSTARTFRLLLFASVKAF